MEMKNKNNEWEQVEMFQVTRDYPDDTETPEQEIERLHKQDGKGNAPRYFALSEVE